MTKESLVQKIWEAYISTEPSTMADVLNEFFSSNVVIPKGKNRHRYADVLHQKLEDISIELEVKQDKARYAGWVNYIGLDFNDEFKIKKLNQSMSGSGIG